MKQATLLSAIVLLSSGFLAAAQAPSLTLFTPEVTGLTVKINGVTLPGAPGTFIVRVQWDWGDGIVEDQWFPATHTYYSAGTYTINVTSFQSNGLFTTQRITVSVGQELSRKVRVYVYAIDDINRTRVYLIDTVPKIAGAQIRVDYPGGYQVLTTTSTFPGPYVLVDENSTVTVSLVAEPPGWRFTNYWDIFGVSWTPGPTRTFNVGTTEKHIAAAFTQAGGGEGQQGSLGVFDLDYKGTPTNSDGLDQRAVRVAPGDTLTLFFRYDEGNNGSLYIIRVYPEWNKNQIIANSDNDETLPSEVGQELGGLRWDKEVYTAPSRPGTYKIRVVYNASSVPPTWDRYDRLLAEGTVVVSEAPSPTRKVKLHVYAIDDINRTRVYLIDTVPKIAGAQIRVDYPGGYQVLTTTST
ncbi:MAG: PKD domain-containing protein, partial [Candidatus Methanomethylicaceae archaeon]